MLSDNDEENNASSSSDEDDEYDHIMLYIGELGKPRSEIIQEAIDASPDGLLDLEEFKQKFYPEIQEIYNDPFWRSLDNTGWIYWNNKVFEWIGYDIKNQENVEEIMNILMNNRRKEGYKIFIDEKEVCIMTKVGIFKKICMMLSTEKCKKVRRFYVLLSELFEVYHAYFGRVRDSIEDE
jgi:hypothetical protein